MNEKKVKEAVEVFTKNPSWKGYYDDAPTKECKRYVALDFYRSQNYSSMEQDEADAVRAEQKELQGKMGLADWKHLVQYQGNNPFRGLCLQKIRELSK